MHVPEHDTHCSGQWTPNERMTDGHPAPKNWSTLPHCFLVRSLMLRQPLCSYFPKVWNGMPQRCHLPFCIVADREWHCPRHTPDTCQAPKPLIAARSYSRSTRN